MNGPASNLRRKVALELQLNQNARIDVVLEVGATQSTITVEGMPLLDQSDSQRGTNIFNTMVENLPLVGRDPSALATLASGTSSAQSGVGSNPPPGFESSASKPLRSWKCSGKATIFPIPRYITTMFNDLRSIYNSLQVQDKRRFTYRLTFLTKNTLSRSFDDSSYDLTTASGGEYQIARDPKLSYALSQFDSPNHPTFPNTILRTGEAFESTTSYTFSIR